jgi:hypothetical protein
MQTSGNSGSMSRSGNGRMVGVAAVGLTALVSLSLLSCTPGVVDCDKVSCNDGSGGATGGSGDEGGGGGGNTGGSTGGTGGDIPASCGDINVASVDDFETKFIIPKCGQMGCHGPASVFPPKNLHMKDMIRPTLVGKKGTLACMSDFYINTSDYMKSFVLAKIKATTDTLACPSPGGKADAGGTRMPNKDGAPGTVGTRLADGEIECFTWYVQQVAKK